MGTQSYKPYTMHSQIKEIIKNTTPHLVWQLNGSWCPLFILDSLWHRRLCYTQVRLEIKGERGERHAAKD